jgi:ketosteroid isomerase-like protein
MEKIIEEYFQAFANKDLQKLSMLYDDNIVLSEWGENIFTGKLAVLKANEELFNKFKNIGVLVKTRAAQNNCSLNEIVVYLDDVDVKVVDSITVDGEKIVGIMAYRGF